MPSRIPCKITVIDGQVCIGKPRKPRSTSSCFESACASFEDSLQQIFESYPIQKSVGKLLFVQHGFKKLQVEAGGCYQAPPTRGRTPVEPNLCMARDSGQDGNVVTDAVEDLGFQFSSIHR